MRLVPQQVIVSFFIFIFCSTSVRGRLMGQTPLKAHPSAKIRLLTFEVELFFCLISQSSCLYFGSCPIKKRVPYVRCGMTDSTQMEILKSALSLMLLANSSTSYKFFVHTSKTFFSFLCITRDPRPCKRTQTPSTTKIPKLQPHVFSFSRVKTHLVFTYAFE